MDTSIFLARVIGLVSVMSTAANLSRYKESIALEHEMAKSPLLVHLSGFTFLVLGTLLVVSHPVWTLDWRLVITVMGWLLLLKGAGRIFFPGVVRRVLERKRDDWLFVLGELAVLLAGGFLLYYGFLA
jgi:hypothetical protein